MEALVKRFIERIPEEKRTAIVLGATGEAGSEIMKCLVATNAFKVSVITRRPIADDNLHDIVHGDLLDCTIDDFSDHTMVFCALGTTRAAAGSADNFVRIDHDLVIGLADKAQHSGASAFLYVSSTGANPNSFFLYPQTKGRTENRLIDLKFPILRVYRPGLLLCERKESRVVEAIGRRVFAPLAEYLFPGRFCISTERLACAMVMDAMQGMLDEQPDAVQFYENKAIYDHWRR